MNPILIPKASAVCAEAKARQKHLTRQTVTYEISNAKERGRFHVVIGSHIDSFSLDPSLEAELVELGYTTRKRKLRCFSPEMNFAKHLVDLWFNWCRFLIPREPRFKPAEGEASWQQLERLLPKSLSLKQEAPVL